MEPTGWNRETSPYHRGEQELQARLGRRESQERVARRIHRPYLPEQHREFFSGLPFVIAGSVDADGRPWASILFGRPGFVSTPDERTLDVRATPFPGDPLRHALDADSPVGFVGVELATRRRNRVNGVVAARDDSGFRVEVVQSFGNCPRYIHTRDMHFVRDPATSVPIETETFTELNDAAVAVIRQADTLFVASHDDQDDKRDTGGADVNHRGGRPGFVRVEGNTLTIPDYVGNFAFNTLGNFLLNPRAGLLFIDFANGDIWQMSGTVDLIRDGDDGDDDLAAFRGAERAWRFHVECGVRHVQAAPLRWRTGTASPDALLTGDWDEAARVRAAAEKGRAWRPFRVSRIVDESATIRSFHLEPADGAGVPPHLPGQHVTLRVAPDGNGDAVRTYTLSSAPSDDAWRISVKREEQGHVSRFLHDRIAAGDTIDVRAPNGAFRLDTREPRPVMLLAGGVGITPMIAMAREIVRHGLRHRERREITVLQAARTTRERAFAAEFTELARRTDGALRYVSVIGRPEPGEVAGEHVDHAGRIDTDILRRYLAPANHDVYLCGPEPFMRSMYGSLIDLGIPDARIFAESFGPATLVREKKAANGVHATGPGEDTSAVGAAGTAGTAGTVGMTDAAVVTFERSRLERRWTPADGTLLEFAEAQGLSPAFGCRSGTCGSCATRVLSGSTVHRHEPGFPVGDGETLPCCAVPAPSGGPLRLDL